MSLSITPMSPAELDRAAGPGADAGLGTLHTERGNLPLDRLDVRATIVGLLSRTELTQEFVNAHDTALAATYVFPLPDRAAVTGMTMTADGRTVEAELRERGAARQAYDEAVAAGRRASIAEEERPDVFTMRVGNIAPGERVSVRLRLVAPLPYEDGAATFRFPLVVAPRYVPGVPLPGPAVGDGYAWDTDAVPDASRISPPVLLPGFPNPLRLSIGVTIDPAGLTLGDVRSSLHTVSTDGNHVRIAPGERADRDFVLRLDYRGAGSSLVCVPDGPDDAAGTFQLTVLPPTDVAAPRPRDVVLLLDRSGSMDGWKMVAARRAAARIVDTLTAADRFTVLTFDDRSEYPPDLGQSLVHASDRHRFRAVEHLAGVQARGGTELLAPLRDGLRLLADARTAAAPPAGTDGTGADPRPREAVLVLVTDGQVGNEDQILRDIGPLVGRSRIHAVGIDRAVNAGFLGRLAILGAGRCELVESEDRLDEAMGQVHRRIGAPLVTDLAITAIGLALTADTRTPVKLPGIYPGVPLVVAGRYQGAAHGSLTVRGRTRDDRAWAATVPVARRDEPAVTAHWARAHLHDLQDRYLAGDRDLESRIVGTSLRFGVLCRFTAYVAVDTRVVTDGGTPHRVMQPVEAPSGWELPVAVPLMAVSFRAAAAPAAAPPGPSAAARAPGGGVRFAAMPADAGRAGSARINLGRRRSTAGPAGPVSAGPRPDPVREIVAVEARRLREAEEQPGYERRDLLDDLASRLGAVLDAVTGPGYEPLRLLVGRLRSGGDLETRWRDARRVLDEFAATGRPHGGADRSETFWKG
ncbi:MAG TPA: VIT domain-containing protein [Catenuloplanes sp.]|jgi:Ca-activated chloride channel family protein